MRAYSADVVAENFTTSSFLVLRIIVVAGAFPWIYICVVWPSSCHACCSEHCRSYAKVPRCFSLWKQYDGRLSDIEIDTTPNITNWLLTARRSSIYRKYIRTSGAKNDVIKLWIKNPYCTFFPVWRRYLVHRRWIFQEQTYSAFSTLQWYINK